MKIRPPSGALRAIAMFEGIKGITAMIASLGLLSLAHHDVRHLAYALIGHFHLDPQTDYPQQLLHYADLLSNANLRAAILFAWGYAAIRLVEGVGLWTDRAWAEWLAALSGGLYVPLEISHLMRHATAINSAVLIGNGCVVVYLVHRLWRRRTARR